MNAATRFWAWFGSCVAAGVFVVLILSVVLSHNTDMRREDRSTVQYVQWKDNCTAEGNKVVENNYDKIATCTTLGGQRLSQHGMS